MNRTTVDDVIVRVESKPTSPAANGGSPPYHPSLKHPAQLQSTSSQQLPQSNCSYSGKLPQSNGASPGKCEPLERPVCDETNDSIWEELASPDLKISGPGLKQHSATREDSGSYTSQENSGRRPGSHLSLERMPREVDSLATLRRDTEPRHRSLDLDIHIDKPDLVMLQDNLVCKPLSDHLVGKDFSFRPKRSDGQLSPSTSQRVVRVVSSSRLSAKPPPSPLQPRFSSVEQRVEEEEEGWEGVGEGRRVMEAADSSSESKRRLIDMSDVKLQLSDGQVNPSTKGEEEGRRSGVSALGSPASVQKNTKLSSIKTVALSKQLLKTRTKSRLVEVSYPLSPAVAGSSVRFDAVKKSTPESPARPSVRKVEAETEEEDPFKDIDMQDKFRQGNLKAVTVAQWVAFVVIMGCLICSLAVRQVKEQKLWGLELWKWFLLMLVVLCGRLLSGWLIRILVIIFEKNFLLRKKVLYFVYGLRKGVQNCLWLGLVLLAWKLMFDPRVERSTSNHKALVLFTRLLECCLISAFIWLAKLLLVKSLASSFHVTTFFDRIQKSLFNQHVLEALSGPPLLDFSFQPVSHQPIHAPVTLSMGKGVTAKKDQQTETITIGDLQKMSTENVSAGVMKRLMNLVKHPGLGTLVTTYDESVYVEDDSDDIEINSELEAKAAARRIFKNVAQRDAGSIEREDLLRFVTSDEVLEALQLFEGGMETGKISKKALKNWVVSVYRERKALAHSLNDTKTAVKELHRMSSVVVIVIIIVVWLLVLGIATTHVLVLFSSQLLLVGFMFSNTVKQVFEAIIFLFVMHPFDVGDRCIIDGIQMVVEEMKILSTVLLKADNEKVFYPNSVLATKPISNLFRSPEMKDMLDFSVHISTPTEKITDLKEKIAAYVERKSEHWLPKFGLIVKELEDLNRMRVSVTMQHTINFQNFGERMNRRSDLLLELKRIFADLGIEYRLLTQPVQLSYPQPSMQYPPPLTYPPPAPYVT